MKTLILDSATNKLYVSLVIDETVVYETYTSSEKGHAKTIMVEIENACKKGGIELINVDKVIVGIGPGSYTGVRMAVTVGKMLATMANDIKLLSISTLVLMASGYTGNVLSTIDARRGNCFGMIYDMNSDSYVQEEALYERTILEANTYDYKVDENEYKVNPLKVISLANLVEEPRTLVPNYLRDTEAERNLNA